MLLHPIIYFFLILSSGKMCLCSPKDRPQITIKVKRNNRWYLSFVSSWMFSKKAFLEIVSSFVCIISIGTKLFPKRKLKYVYIFSFKVMYADITLERWNFRLVQNVHTPWRSSFQRFSFRLYAEVMSGPHYSYQSYIKLNLPGYSYNESTCQLLSSPSTLSVADGDRKYTCWMSSGDKRDLCHHSKGKDIYLSKNKVGD